MKIKKIPYYLAPWFLMAGASLTVGLLSFGGMLAIWSFLPFAIGTFVLSVAYEGQVYLKNTKESLKKLFKSKQLERDMAKTCLLEHGFPDKPEKDRPQFLKDYERQLHLLHRFEGKRIDKASSDRKRHVEKTLSDMEKWFAVQLFSAQEGTTDYQKKLRVWLSKSRQDKKPSVLAEFQAKNKSRYTLYQMLKIFCLAAGVFMGLGTSYLLVEAFAIIPWLAVLPAASLPIFIVPLAAIAGLAYGLLVYNAMTDMIASEMVATWFKKIGKDLANPKTWWSGVGKISVLAAMFLITLALSICTAGTWWTVVKTSRPLFGWMSKIPAFIMLVLNPVILSVSTWAFNVENVSETLEMAEPYLDSWLGENSESTTLTEQAPTLNEKCDGIWKGDVYITLSAPDLKEQQIIMKSKKIVFVQNSDCIEMWYCDNNDQCRQTKFNNPKIVDLVKSYAQAGNVKNTIHLNEIKTFVLSTGIRTELWLQRMNPFRLFIHFVFDPLRQLLFLGHLFSIGATADQVPGIPPIIPAVLGAASEGVEDLHYFKLRADTPHEHKHDTQSLLKERLGAKSGHDHGSDLPTMFLWGLFSPFYVLAAGWDFLCSPENDKWSSWEAFVMVFGRSWNKETGTPEEETVEFAFAGSDPCCKEKTDVNGIIPLLNSRGSEISAKSMTEAATVHSAHGSRPNAWQTEHALFRIEKEKNQLAGMGCEDDVVRLTELQEILQIRQKKVRLKPESLESIIDNTLKSYKRNGFFKEDLIERTFDTSLHCMPCALGSSGG